MKTNPLSIFLLLLAVLNGLLGATGMAMCIHDQGEVHFTEELHEEEAEHCESEIVHSCSSDLHQHLDELCLDFEIEGEEEDFVSNSTVLRAVAPMFIDLSARYWEFSPQEIEELENEFELLGDESDGIPSIACLSIEKTVFRL